MLAASIGPCALLASVPSIGAPPAQSLKPGVHAARPMSPRASLIASPFQRSCVPRDSWSLGSRNMVGPTATRSDACASRAILGDERRKVIDAAELILGAAARLERARQIGDHVEAQSRSGGLRRRGSGRIGVGRAATAVARSEPEGRRHRQHDRTRVAPSDRREPEQRRVENHAADPDPSAHHHPVAQRPVRRERRNEESDRARQRG